MSFNEGQFTTLRMSITHIRYYEGKRGALRQYCVTRWWSAVEVMCRPLQWRIAVEGAIDI